MAAIAVVHVFISHFAIGGGLYLVVTEHWARRRGDAAALAYLERLSRFFVLTTLVAGALTGVAIWFVIGLLNPAATELLIHHFVWGWAIEWTFFAVEILAAILYYYGWRRLAPRAHLALGWVYFAAAWLSLAVINGILSFMLTPGRWLETRSFWDGFWNPGYLPSLVLRTGICAMLAGVWALLVASRLPADETKARLVRLDALWALGGLAVTWPAFRWYFTSLPGDVLDTAREAMPAVMAWHDRIGILAAALAIAVVMFALALGRRLRLAGALVRLDALWALGGLAVTWPAFRWYFTSLPGDVLDTAREAMPAVMAWHDRVGILAAALAIAVVMFALALGRRLRLAGALVPLALAFAWFGSFEFLRESIRKPWIVTGVMYGNAVEADQLPVLQRDGLLAHVAFRSGDDGRDLFLRACRSCHTLDGYKALRVAFDGTDERFVAGAIRGAERIRGNMPPFAGSPDEVETLAAWIAQHIDRRPLGEVHGLTGAALGARAFDVRCGLCHVPGGYQDPIPTLAGSGPEEIAEFLDMSGEIAEEMPAYTGEGEEREALVAHLVALAAEQQP